MNKYLKWRQMSLNLKKLKAEEMKMRKTLCAEIFEGQVGKLKKKFEIEDICVVTAEAKIAHKLDKGLVNQIFEELTDEDKNALKFTPELKLREYKKLSDESLLHEAVLQSPAAPTLKVDLIEEEKTYE